jgi:hypothetical protein
MKPGAVGDVNNDGFADFLGRLIWDGSEDWGALWLVAMILLLSMK